MQCCSVSSVGGQDITGRAAAAAAAAADDDDDDDDDSHVSDAKATETLRSGRRTSSAQLC